MQKLNYNPLFVVGVSALCVVGVFAVSLIFRSDHQQSALHESNNTETRLWAVSNTQVSLPNIDNKQKNSNSEPPDISVTASISTSVIDDSYCSGHCRESLERLRLLFDLNDDEYEKILGRSDELATYLLSLIHI